MPAYVILTVCHVHKVSTGTSCLSRLNPYISLTSSRGAFARRALPPVGLHAASELAACAPEPRLHGADGHPCVSRDALARPTVDGALHQHLAELGIHFSEHRVDPSQHHPPMQPVVQTGLPGRARGDGFFVQLGT